MSVFLPIYSGATVNFAESVDTVTPDMREIFPTFFLAVPRIWEKMMACVIIKMKDATWLKKKTYRLCMPIGERMAEARLGEKRIPLALRIRYALAYVALFDT